MTDNTGEALKKSDESQGKYECGADCPDCSGGTCFLEANHSGFHHCGSCGNTWESFHHVSSSQGL
jgi:hypothetical protein